MKKTSVYDNIHYAFRKNILDNLKVNKYSVKYSGR